jgi:hypothetical protein
MRRAVAALAAAAVALTLGACSASDIPGIGGDDSGTKQGKAASAVVKRFALAAGPEACDMFTPAGLRRVYGKDEPAGPPPLITAPPPAISLAECRRRAPQFSGQKVKITRVVLLPDSNAVRADATTDDGGGRAFTVTLRRKGDVWLIDEIMEK